jgi:hypothetical protein
MDVHPEATPAPAAQPLPQPLFRFDPGWPFVVAGLGLLVCAVLIPAQRDLQQLRNTLEVHRALEDQSLRRLEAYDRFLADLDRNDEQLVRRLAASQLNLMPKEQRSVLLTSSVNATVTDWIDASEPLELPTPEAYPDTLLARLATGPRRLWVLACGVFLVFIGLLLGPSNASGTSAARRSARREADSLDSIGAGLAAAGAATAVLESRANSDTAQTPHDEPAQEPAIDAVDERSSSATGALENGSVDSLDPDASSDEFVRSIAAEATSPEVAEVAEVETVEVDAVEVEAVEAEAVEVEAVEFEPIDAVEMQAVDVEPREIELAASAALDDAMDDACAVETTVACSADPAQCASTVCVPVEDAAVTTECDAELGSELEASAASELVEEVAAESEAVRGVDEDGATLVEDQDADLSAEVEHEIDAEVEHEIDAEVEHEIDAEVEDEVDLEVEDEVDREVEDELDDTLDPEREIDAREPECDEGDEIARAESKAIPGEVECEADAELPSANDRALDSRSLFHGLSEDRWVDTRDPRG